MNNPPTSSGLGGSEVEAFLTESAELYAQVYSDDEELRQLTELAVLEPIID